MVNINIKEEGKQKPELVQIVGAIAGREGETLQQITDRTHSKDTRFYVTVSE